MSFTGGKGDVAINDPYMAVLGEPLKALAQNLGRTNNGYVSASTTNKVVSQGFNTGNATFGYRLQGIGVNIEGSGSNYPDGPTSVSVAVHADSSGQPGKKLVDLVSPTEYAAGHSFFEAPPGTHLAPGTFYVLVWSHLGGTTHRLQRTSSDFEDAGALGNFKIANVYYRGADLDNLSADSGSNALEIAAYGEINTETVVYITPPPPPPPPPPFVPSVSGGGGAFIRCSSPPAASCPTYDDATDSPLLSTTLRVEDITGTSGQIVREQAGFNNTIGSLDSRQFTYLGTSYSIDTLHTLRVTAGTTVVTDVLTLAIDLSFPTTFPAELALELDGQKFLLNEANRISKSFHWDNHGPNLGRNRLRRSNDHRAPAAERLRLQDHLDRADDGGVFPTFYCFRIQPY